jgi:hypothetical protein
MVRRAAQLVNPPDASEFLRFRGGGEQETTGWSPRGSARAGETPRVRTPVAMLHRRCPAKPGLDRIYTLVYFEAESQPNDGNARDCP